MSRKVRGLLPATLLAYHHVGYPLLLWAWDTGRTITNDGGPIRVGPRRHDAAPRPAGAYAPAGGSRTADPTDHATAAARPARSARPPDPAADAPARPPDPGRTAAVTRMPLPRVALIIPAHNEAQVIRMKIQTSLELDYPRELLRIVVAADGCTDDTVQAARDAGADLVLDLPRGGKMAAQHAAIAQTGEPILAFSDANSIWEPRALIELVTALDPPRAGYACGHVRFVINPPDHDLAVPERVPGSAIGQPVDIADADNQEGLYWRYEMAIRARESRLASVTAGNGAIYAIKHAAYSDYRFDPVMGHDLAMPFQLVRAGWLAVDVAAARAVEKMVPTIEGEHKRKRRMMSHAWPIVLHAGMLDLRGQPPRYALMLVSHRWLRYAAPLVHGWLAVASLRGARRSRIARALLAGQALLLVAAARPDAAPKGPARTVARLCRYYVMTNASIALGLYDHVAHGTQASWTPPEGTR